MPVGFKFLLIQRPYYDPRTGNPVDIRGRNNRPNIDPFIGGGKVGYPDLSKVLVLKRAEKGIDLYVLVEGEQPDIDNLLKGESITYQETPSIRKSIIVIPTILTDKEIEAIFPPEKVESGVTK